MKSLRILASLMLASLLAFSAAPATTSISADSQHQPQHEPKKEKPSKDNKDDSNKEKDSKKDKDKVDKAIDDLDKALDGDKGKGSKKDDSDSKKEKDSEKNDSGKEKDAKNDKSSGHSDYEGTYIGNSDNRLYEIELKLEKAKKGPLYTVEGSLKHSAGGFPKPGIYSVKGSFSPKTGKLRATYKAQNENALGKGNVDGEYENGSFTLTFGKSLVIQGVTKQ